MRAFILATVAIIAGLAPTLLVCALEPKDCLMAQVPSPVSPTGLESVIINALAELGSSGFMAALCWYMLSKALPRKDEANETQRKEHLTAFSEQRDQFCRELKEERDTHRDSIKTLVAEMAASRNAQMEIVRKCSGRVE